MKIIATINNIDFVLPNENSVEFINDKALVKLIGIARSGHHFNEDQDRKLSSEEFKNLLCSFTNDKRLIYTLINRYKNIILNTDIYALINKDFKEYDLAMKGDFYLDEFLKSKFKLNHVLCTKKIERLRENDFIIIDNTGCFHIKLSGNNIVGCKVISEDFKKINIPNILKSEHKLYNLDTMEASRYYDYIGNFKEYLRKDGSSYYAAHTVKNITVKENIDGVERTETSTLDFFIDEEGKVISHIFSSFHNDLLMGGDKYYDEVVDEITTKLNELLENRSV